MKASFVAARARSIPSSATVRIADAVTEMRQRGEDVLDFSAGRASEATPEYIVEAAARAMAGGDTHQTPAQGKRAFREACAAKLARDNAIVADPDTELVTTLGCKQGLVAALLATLDPGDEVLVEDPGFVSYAPAVRYSGGVPVPVPLERERGFRWTREALDERVSSKTKSLVFCSPHNPTGALHTDADLETIASVARDRDLLVYADETYERLTWSDRPHRSIATLPGMRERTVTLMGLTKGFCMGGWRVGFAFAPPPTVDAMVSVQQHLVTCASSFAQTAGAVAYAKEPPTEVTALWLDWEERTRHVTSSLDALPRVHCAMPEGAFYAWADVRELGASSESVAQRLLEEHRVAVVPGAAFGPGGEGFLRITCARSWEEIEEGLPRIQAGLH